MRSSHGDGSETIRRARPDDIEPILTLLTEYELPRSSFEPFYMHDTSYRPEHSWVVEQQGRLLSHIRIYDRWTHLAGRSGWVPIEQEVVRAVLHPALSGSVRIGPAQQQELPALMHLYDVANAQRTGTTGRSPEYWQELPLWLQEKANDLLVAHENALDTPVGYVRSRVTQDALEILELASEGDSPDIAHSLLTTSAMQLDGHLLGHFPPSMRTIFLPGEFGVRDDPGLMGRVINLAALASALAPQWVERLLEAGRD